jgi:hypothetical protein
MPDKAAAETTHKHEWQAVENKLIKSLIPNHILYLLFDDNKPVKQAKK